MKTNFHDTFTAIIKDKFPQRGRLANQLIDILSIEKEAVYRRLRGEVPFTFEEVAEISNRLNISLDEIVGQSTSTIIDKPIYSKFNEFITPTEEDYKSLQMHVNLIDGMHNDPDSAVAWVSGILSTPLCLNFKYLYNFYLFKWNYQFEKSDNIKKYGDVQASDRLRNINKEYTKRIQQAEKTTYIFNEKTIEEVIEDIKYFVSVRLITKEEAVLLKEELSLLLDELERLTISGGANAKKKVEIYISALTFETNFGFIKKDDIYLTLIRLFTTSHSYSTDKLVFDNIFRWMNSLKRSSTLISESGEIERIKFFEKQRKLINDCCL